jgi:acyl carrier protein
VTTVEKLREFVLTELHWDEARGKLTPDFPLIENHVVDSMGLLMLVSFVEEQFGIALEDEELVPDHFGTIGSIAQLVERKLAPK